MKKNIVIIILTILVLGLGGYLVYNKVIDKAAVEKKVDNQEEEQEVKEEVIEQKDAAYFDEYLKAFLSCDGIFVSRNTDDFSNKDISNFVSRYYNLLSDGNGAYKANVSDVDTLVYKYFNKNNVVLETNPSAATTITKENNVYDFKWEPVGCGYNGYKDSTVTYNGENVTVKYNEYSMIEEKYTGKILIFHLKYNNGNYNIIKIEA